MFHSRQRLLQLNTRLAENLLAKGVEATSDETTTALVDKVANISVGGDDSLLKGLIQRDLTELEISGVKYVGKYAFYNYEGLVKVTIDGVETIGNNAFERCGNLASVELKSGLKEIGGSSFRYCGNITEIIVPTGTEKILTSAFQMCPKLKKLVLPNSITYLGNLVFGGCTNLVEVALGDGFNCNNLNLSVSTLYSRETILQWLNALADRTGQTAYTLTIGAENLAKLTEEDIAIATVKNWTLA